MRFKKPSQPYSICQQLNVYTVPSDISFFSTFLALLISTCGFSPVLRMQAVPDPYKNYKFCKIGSQIYLGISNKKREAQDLDSMSRSTILVFFHGPLPRAWEYKQPAT